MSLKNIVTALAAVSLATAPAMAAAQPAPAQETVEGSQLGEDDSGVGQILPLFVIAAIVLLIRELVKDDDSGDPPISP
jgi:hypothetical protein